MKYRLLIGLCTSVWLSGCVVNRPIEDVATKNEELAKAMSRLYGDYVVRDSRSNRSNITFVRLSSYNGKPVIQLFKAEADAPAYQPKETQNYAGGKIWYKCDGYPNEKLDYALLTCNDKYPDAGGFRLMTITKPTTISSDSWVVPHEPMTIEKGLYYLDYGIAIGRGGWAANGRFSLEKIR